MEFWSWNICLSRIYFRNIGGHCEKAKQSHIRGDLCGRLPLRYCYCQCSCAAFSFLGSEKQAGGTLVFLLRQRLKNLCFSRHFCPEHPGPGLHNNPRELLANMRSVVLYTLFSPESSVYHWETKSLVLCASSETDVYRQLCRCTSRNYCKVNYKEICTSEQEGNTA